MIEAFGEANKVPEQHVFLINLEIDELITNYVRHSLHKVPRPRMELTLRVDDDKLILQILDTGPPFNPLEAPAPDLSDNIEERSIGGMGLHLVRSYCNHMKYELLEGCNLLTLEHNLPEANAAEDKDASEETTT